MPYANEHSVRYRTPSKTRYSRYRRANNDFGEGIDVIYGILRKATPTGRKTEVQAVRFRADMYSWEDVKQLVHGGLKELGQPLKMEPAKTMKKNPYTDKELDNVLMYFIKEESSGVRNYTRFYQLLKKDPKFHRYAFVIRNIIEDEERHLYALKEMLGEGR